MKFENSNFDGDWDESCPFCGKPQIQHQENLGTHDGITYLHRQPCAEEAHEINIKWVKRGIAIRTISFVYNIAKYIWDKVPSKDEFKLLWQLIKHIFISIRAICYLIKRKP